MQSVDVTTARSVSKLFAVVLWPLLRDSPKTLLMQAVHWLTLEEALEDIFTILMPLCLWDCVIDTIVWNSAGLRSDRRAEVVVSERVGLFCGRSVQYKWVLRRSCNRGR